MTDEQCTCGLCGSTFADALAWAAHRPWKSRIARHPCKWPKSLYPSAGGWTLRPDAVAAIEKIENGPADEWKVRRSTPEARKPLPDELPKKALATARVPEAKVAL